jgi:hypothetical protein
MMESSQGASGTAWQRSEGEQRRSPQASATVGRSRRRQHHAVLRALRCHSTLRVSRIDPLQISALSCGCYAGLRCGLA